MKFKKQITQDIQQNKKIIVYIEPKIKYDVEFNPLEENIVSDELGGMVRVYPSGSKEIISYEITDLYNYSPDATEPMSYIQYNTDTPTSSVYSLLNKKVKYKNFYIDKSKILLGTVPEIASITQSANSEDNVIQSLGIIIKDKYYYEKLKSVEEDISETDIESAKTCYSLDSISNERIKENIKYVCRGNVLNTFQPYFGGTEDSYIEGVEYDVKGYNIDFYNKIIIPFITTSLIDSTQTGPVQNLIQVNKGDGGYTEKSFSSKVKSIVTYDYEYIGEDPLLNKTSVETDLYGKSYINLNNFLVLAHVSSDLQFKNVIIANKYNYDYSCTIEEHDINNYETIKIEDILFYKNTSSIKSRQEDCLIADVLGKKVLYQCSKGAGQQSGLASILSLLESKQLEPILKNTSKLDIIKAPRDGQPSMQYQTRSGSDMVPVLDVLERGGSLHILNDALNIIVGKERFERSMVTMFPLGKNSSHRTLYSERVGEIQQDFDSKLFIGGQIQLKTYTVPTYQYESIAKDTELKGTDRFNSVGYENVVYVTENDVDTVVENYTKMNNYLNKVTVVFKGITGIDTFEMFMENKEYILDKITQDLATNVTTFNCRTVIFN